MGVDWDRLNMTDTLTHSLIEEEAMTENKHCWLCYCSDLLDLTLSSIIRKFTFTRAFNKLNSKILVIVENFIVIQKEGEIC